MSRPSVRTPPLFLALFALGCALGFSQNKSSAKGSSSGSSSSSGGSQAGGATAANDSSASGPFSIETEMFTYKAVEHNSELIACDTAQYLYNGAIADAPPSAHAPCSVGAVAAVRPGIILISSGSTLLADFQLWRTDMATMRNLVNRAKNTCVAVPSQSGATPEPSSEPSHLRARGLLGTALGGLASPGEAASTLGTVLQMFSKNQSVSSVVGTVEDPALMNEVARQLRSLNVQVLVPELYSPNALGGIDFTHSPYLQSLQSVSDSYEKCAEAKAGHPAGSPQAMDIDAVLAGMDSFLKDTFAPPSPKPSAANNANEVQGAQTEGQSAPPSHFASVLASDELAKKLGFSFNGAADSASPWQHVLWVKALESGGSVTKQGNLFGTKVLFGGGAVDTYSVFSLTGDLVCSGNVYSFQRPVNVKDFDHAVHTPNPETPAKWASEHSTCAPLN